MEYQKGLNRKLHKEKTKILKEKLDSESKVKRRELDIQELKHKVRKLERRVKMLESELKASESKSQRLEALTPRGLLALSSVRNGGGGEGPGAIFSSIVEYSEDQSEASMRLTTNLVRGEETNGKPNQSKLRQIMLNFVFSKFFLDRKSDD